MEGQKKGKRRGFPKWKYQYEVCNNDISLSQISDSSVVLESSQSEHDLSIESTDEVDPIYLKPQFNADKDNNLDISLTHDPDPSLPLVLVLNARSVYNKADNLRHLLHTICPDICLVSESWSREDKPVEKLLSSTRYKSVGYHRKKVGSAQPGGGCEILYNECSFTAENPNIIVPPGVEAISRLFNNKTRGCVKIIAVCSFYISPRSKFKHETVQHFIETIHMMRAKYDDKIHILLAGDANKFPITPVLNSYGQLRQICSIPTRKNATLELIITDLWGLYHPPSSMPPLKVDQDKKGKDSDHAIIIFAPKSNDKFYLKSQQKVIPPLTRKY